VEHTWNKFSPCCLHKVRQAPTRLSAHQWLNGLPLTCLPDHSTTGLFRCCRHNPAPAAESRPSLPRALGPRPSARRQHRSGGPSLHQIRVHRQNTFDRSTSVASSSSRSQRWIGPSSMDTGEDDPLRLVGANTSSLQVGMCPHHLDSTWIWLHGSDHGSS
jgi:hypothetical protein